MVNSYFSDAIEWEDFDFEISGCDGMERKNQTPREMSPVFNSQKDERTKIKVIS